MSGISKKVQQAFEGIDGFKIYNSGPLTAKRNKTYGEILPIGMEKLCEKVQFDEDDYFVDLGSGVGKMTMRVFLAKPYGIKSRGIEIARHRHDMAMIARSRLKHINIKNLGYAHDDIRNASNWSEATVIYANVLAFEPELKEFIVQSLLTHETVRCVIFVGYQPLCPLPSWRVWKVEEDVFPMTWAENMPVSIAWLTPVESMPMELIRLEKQKSKIIQQDRKKLEKVMLNKLERATSLEGIDENSTNLKDRRRSSVLSNLTRQGSYVPLSSPRKSEERVV